MTTVTMQEAQANLPTIISRLKPGEEVMIIDEGRPLAAMKKADRPQRRCAGVTSAELMALAKTNKAAPDDKTVREWIDEYRVEKYGRSST